MKPILSRAQIRAFDACATNDCHVPSIVLMENAGRGATDVLERTLLARRVTGKRILVACGTGNNGGDGFVAARHLLLRGANVRLVLIGDPAHFSHDARLQHDAWTGIGGTVDRDYAADFDADVVVDALFGTGLDRPLTGRALETVERINASHAKIFALDIPSGLDADTGVVHGAAIRAHATATFAHYKRGLLTPNGASFAGEISVVDIGVPAALFLRTGSDAELAEEKDIASAIVARKKDDHKYSAGHVGIIAGSLGKTGASLLCARGAMRAGAGAASVATWSNAASSLEARMSEVMIARIDEAQIETSVDAFVHGKKSIVIGPGLGATDETQRIVKRVMATFEGTLVLDADALTAFAAHASDLASSSRAKLILTPHAGEAGRLLGISSAAVEADRYVNVRTLAKTANAVVLLKGANTLIANSEGRVVVSSIVCPALATAGAGDVLAGVVGALGCALSPFDAAYAGAWLHGRSAVVWSEANGDRGLLASEVADGIPNVLYALMENHTSRP